MGKRYFCEYCDKTMVSSPSIIRTHNNGLAHKKMVQEHYQKYKDPSTILSEEREKKICNRFMNGSCQFGSLCHYSHYTPEQIHALQLQVEASKAEATVQPEIGDVYEKLQEYKKQTEDTDSIVFLNNGESLILPWSYNSMYDKFELPPSLKRFDVQVFKDAEVCEWG